MLTHKDFFTYGMLVLNVGYILIEILNPDRRPVIMISLDFWIKVYMGIYLIWKFNPFFPGAFTDFDRRIVFAAGTFLLSITIVEYYLKAYIDNIKDKARYAVAQVKSEIMGWKRN